MALSKKRSAIRSASIVTSLDTLEEIVFFLIKDKLTFKHTTTYNHRQDLTIVDQIFLNTTHNPASKLIKLSNTRKTTPIQNHLYLAQLEPPLWSRKYCKKQTHLCGSWIYVHLGIYVTIVVYSVIPVLKTLILS